LTRGAGCGLIPKPFRVSAGRKNNRGKKRGGNPKHPKHPNQCGKSPESKGKLW
jgi:hypothetical protein